MALALHHESSSPVKMGRYLLAWWLLLVAGSGSCLCCRMLEDRLGNVTDDHNLEIGSTLVFRCTIYDRTIEENNITSSDIILKSLTKEKNITSSDIILRNRVLSGTRIVDRNTVEYTLHNASTEDTGTYSCFVPRQKYTSPTYVCSSYIAVGYKPLDVKNFTCISYGYSNLTCTWVAPYNPVPTQYVLYDFLHNNDRYSRKCPVPFRSGCQFRLDTIPPYMQTQDYLNFFLIGNNSLGDLKQYFRLKHSEIIKPNLPHTTTEDVSRSSLSLRLEAPRGLQNGEFLEGLLYSVRYYSISTKLEANKVEVVEAHSNARLFIEDLVPNTLYRFEVRCRINFAEKFLWSDSFNITEMTLPDVPYLAPVIDSSSFDMQVIAGNRTITLYWKAVPSEFENGNDFHYKIRYHEHYIPKRTVRQANRRTSLSVRVDNKTSHSFEHMDMGTAYMFTIIASNSMGDSANESAIIVVDKADKFLQGPKDITVVSYDQGTYDISWKNPDNSLSHNSTLFWCETLKLRPAKCEGPLGSTRVVNATSHKLYLPSNSTNYQFAVATVGDRRTSGMVWAPCTVVYGVKYKIRKIELVPKNSTSLRIRWSLKCEAEKKVIQEYAIYYCPYGGKCSYENAKICQVNGSGVMDWPFQRVTNLSQSEHILGPLDPFTCYFSYIRVRTDAGWGENSEFASEITMSSAPSGPPTNVHASPTTLPQSKMATIKLSFDSPITPNGIITRYKIFYSTLPDGQTLHKEVRVQANHNEVLLENVHYFANYSVEVSACVDQACSDRSDAVVVYTGISHPGIITPPRVELLGDFLNITWEVPHFPNGPAQFYQVRMSNNDTNFVETFNITGQNHYALERECANGDPDLVYSFQVRAVNFRDGLPLFGEYSGPVNNVMCPSGFLTGYNAGLFVGVVIGFIILVMVISYLVRYFHRNINEAKKTQIKLPKGLESPLDVNPLSSYDKFKSGLQNSRDSGIPNDRAYDRLFSSSSEGDLKNSDEPSKRSKTGRNPSGESSTSTKGQDSISSANTTKTHNSLDSGAEVESPPSPDSFSSDGVNTTPRSFKQGDNTRASQAYRSTGSRDSGLAKDDTRPIHGVTNLAMTSKGRCFQHEYYKFIKKGGLKYPVPMMSLSNSEPSVAEFDLGDGSEPLVNPGMPPYCKLHLSNSAGNGLNSIDSAYSKWGGETFYRPIPTYRRVPPQHFQVFSAFTNVSRQPIPITSRKKEVDTRLKTEDVASLPPNSYMSVSDVINSAKNGSNSIPSHHQEPDRCEQDRSEQSSDDGSQQALIPHATSSGYVPVEISYPDIDVIEVVTNDDEVVPDEEETKSPDAEIVSSSLSEIFPPNFVLESNSEQCREENLPSGPCEAVVRSNLFHGGGRVFLNDLESEEQGQRDNWCELGSIQIDPETYAEKQTDCHVISRPNLANVPVVESV